jgi:tetratricopeptide (TPR) repeat protein
LDISEKIGYKKGIANGLYQVGKFYDKTGDQKKSGEFLQRALNISKENNYRLLEAKVLLYYGLSSHEKSDDNAAFTYYTQALNLFKTEKDSIGMAKVYQNIGTCFMDKVSFGEAMQNFNKAIEIYKLKNQPHDFGLLCWNIALLYLRHRQYDTGVHYLYQSIDIFKRNQDTITLGLPMNALAAYFQETHHYDSATWYYNKALNIARSTGNKRQQAIALFNIGVSDYEAVKYSEAEKNLRESLILVKEISYEELLIEVEHGLAVLYAHMHNYEKAYRYYDTAYINMDSFRNVEKEKSMTEMTARYNNSELESKNILLKKENDLEHVKLKSKNILIYAGFGSAVLLLIIGLQIVRHNKLRANQRLLQLEQKQLLAQMNPHFIFNCLNSIQQFVVQNDSENANKYLADFALLMRQTLDNSKDGIIPLKREIDYLENYLSLECMRFENKFSYSINCAKDVNINTIEIPSMIIQPFVENAIHHGLRNLATKAGWLIINFYKNKDNLYCEVDDNGIGMEESQKLREQRFIQYQSHGMELTRQRLALVSKMQNAEYEVSVMNKTNAQLESEGTKIIIKFPIRT